MIFINAFSVRSEFYATLASEPEVAFGGSIDDISAAQKRFGDRLDKHDED
jgi:hypothetical protein